MIRMRNAGLLIVTILLSGASLRLQAQGHAASGNGSGGGAAEVAALPDAPVARIPARAMPAPDRFNDYAQLSHPISPKEKFERAMIESVWPGSFGAAVGAGISMASDSTLEQGYGMGGIGFGRRFLANLGENATDLVVGDFALASIGHQDPRYHPSPHRGFGRRLGWAISRVFVTQTDSGKKQFNYSHLFGIASGAAVANAWHRDIDRGGPETAQRFGWDLLASIGANIGREFWDFRHAPRQ